MIRDYAAFVQTTAGKRCQLPRAAESSSRYFSRVRFILTGCLSWCILCTLMKNRVHRIIDAKLERIADWRFVMATACLGAIK